MNGPSTKTFEQATTYKVTDNRLNVLQGQKQVATYAAGCWESVEVIELLDSRNVSTDAPKPDFKVHGTNTTPMKTTTRNGDKIRTSPHRKGGKVGGRK
jgi:hypothetical protein